VALTAREREVLCLLAAGCSDKEMVEALGICFSTLRTHLESIYAKIDAAGRMAAALWAREQGLGPEPPG
jgi:DNA-binding NarL/FixJ family response regulator